MSIDQLSFFNLLFVNKLNKNIISRGIVNITCVCLINMHVYYCLHMEFSQDYKSNSQTLLFHTISIINTAVSF